MYSAYFAWFCLWFQILRAGKCAKQTKKDTHLKSFLLLGNFVASCMHK